jgi:hypothetical protein
MSQKEIPICPKCDSREWVQKVSTVYLEGPDPVPGEDRQVARMSKAEASELHQLLAPPSGKSQVTRPIHPDLMLLVFSGILPLFLVGIFNKQRPLLLPVLVVVALSYVVYFWQRSRLIARYSNLKKSQVEDVHQTERAIGRWMKMYYCAQDHVVFMDGSAEFVVAEQAGELMWKGGRSLKP